MDFFINETFSCYEAFAVKLKSYQIKEKRLFVVTGSEKALPVYADRFEYRIWEPYLMALMTLTDQP